MHLTFRVDSQDPLPHHLNFRLPDGSLHGVDLPVGIGYAHIIHINQCNGTDSGTRQCFRSPRADTTDADNTETGPGK